jgi:uncharacterized membrane protein
MSAAAVILLLVVAALCLAGVFAASYRDNWPQFTGLTLLAIWAAGELLALARGYQPHPRELVLYVALAAFLAGTAWKVVQHRAGRCTAEAHSTQPGEAS